jgi:hypothetical protein
MHNSAVSSRDFNEEAKTMQIALARGLAETTAGTAVTVNSIVVLSVRFSSPPPCYPNMSRLSAVSKASRLTFPR